MGWWGRLGGWLERRRGCRRRRRYRRSLGGRHLGGPGPRKDEVGIFWLGGIIGIDFTNLLDLLFLGFPNDTYTTAFLLLWLTISLLECMTDRG